MSNGIGDNVLIYDIETATVDKKPNAQKDKFKVFGAHSYKTNKTFLVTSKEDVQTTINNHRFLVGFNNAGTKSIPGYDNPILIREGIKFTYKKIMDLRLIFKLRASQMKIKKGMLGDLIMQYSLDYITRLLDIVDDNSAKGEMDYNILKKPIWTKEDIKIIDEYTRRDIEITKKLYEWLEDYFASFKDYIKQKDIDDKLYLTASMPALAYKAICKALGWEEQYGGQDDGIKIGGGYVAYPAGEKFEGDIYCLDFNSLYPHIMMMCNLYGRKQPGTVTDRPFWYGGDVWKVEGTYFADEMAGVGKLLQKWYGERVDYKKAGNRKEYTLKIFINIVYGILNTPYYTLVCDKTAGGDCTRIGRQWTKYARKKFKEAGYKLLATDTDSCFILDPFHDKERMLKIKQQIIDDIQASVPFPQDTFDMGIDDEIKYMFFFKGKTKEEKDSDKEMDEDDFLNKPKGFMKKNYIYVTQDDRVVIKNLGIKKKDRSPLVKKIFWEHLVPQIKTGTCKFAKTYLRNLIMELLKEDMNLVALRKSVGAYDDYPSKTSIQAQIAQKYGAGIHFLLPNNRGIGVGKGKSFCTMEEFKERGLRIDNIDLDNVWKELEYFIIPPVVRDIFSFGKKKDPNVKEEESHTFQDIIEMDKNQDPFLDLEEKQKPPVDPFARFTK